MPFHRALARPLLLVLLALAAGAGALHAGVGPGGKAPSGAWLGAAPAAAQPPAAGMSSAARALIGDWNGMLMVGGQRIRIIFHFLDRPGDKLVVVMDSPDQGMQGLPADSVFLKRDGLKLVLNRIGGSYRGVPTADGTRIKGTWTQGGFSMPLDLGRGQAPERRRFQDPVKPYPYDEEEVVVRNRAAAVKLAGTLTKPRGAGPFPAVVLVTGSGPQNRDEELLGHRPFLVLADRLTRAGFEVLRCDDRGTAKSTGNYAAATTADFATDVRAEVAYLRSRPEVDPAHVGLIGHSEGGLIAPLLAAQDKTIDFIVLLAGPGVPGDSLLTLQGAALMKAAGQRDSLAIWNRRLQRKLFAVVKAAKDTVGLRKRLRQTILRSLNELPVSHRGQITPAFLEQQVEMVSSPWFRWFLAYDPRPALRRTTCPVLAVAGGNDLQVPPKENLPAIAAALRAGGNRDFKTLELPGLDHLLQTSATGLPADYGTIEETMAPAALDTITAWLRARAGKSGR